MTTHVQTNNQGEAMARPKSKDEQVWVRIDPTLKRKLQKAADDDRRSVSAYIALLIEEHFSGPTGKSKKK